jgi:hypothetical protein
MGLVSSLFPWRPALEQHLDRPVSGVKMCRSTAGSIGALGWKPHSVGDAGSARSVPVLGASQFAASFARGARISRTSVAAMSPLSVSILVGVRPQQDREFAREDLKLPLERASPALDSGGADIGTLGLPLGFEELTGVGASRLRCIAWGPMTSSGRLRAFRRCRISAVLADFRSIGYNL